MKLWSKKIIVAAITIVMIFLLFAVSASAAENQMLPDNFLIIDENGMVVSASDGLFFIDIPAMERNVTYTKKIFLQNMERTGGYQLFMRAEPVAVTGNADLFEYCDVTLSLDGKEFYRGSPNGLGNIDMMNEVVSLGSFKEGDKKELVMTARVKEDLYDNWDRILYEWKRKATNPEDASQTSMKLNAEIQFQWEFSAVKDEVSTPPHTGIDMRTILYFIIAGLSIMTLILYILAMRKRKKEKAAALPSVNDQALHQGGLHP